MLTATRREAQDTVLCDDEHVSPIELFRSDDTPAAPRHVASR